MTNNETFRECVRIVHAHRERTEHVYPWPGDVQCLRYAVQEMAEYDDVCMREASPEHKRNNKRQPDARHELAQAGYMMCSAFACNDAPDIVEVSSPLDHTRQWAVSILKLAAAIIIHDVDNGRMEFAREVRYAFDAWLDICKQAGVQPIEAVNEICAQVEAKYLAEESPR